ncbi:hypothetical protein N665_0523s0016 [Sinapis alba]|nr:hypothetical protein N665_0523s0016 [Sinapis alba]
MEWGYKDQGFKKLFKTKDLRHQKQILILLPTAYINKDMSVKSPTSYKSFRERHIRHVMLKDPRLKKSTYICL